MTLPAHHRLPVRHLATVFARTTNVYKHYWLLAWVDHLQSSSDRFVRTDHLLARMISLAWHPVHYYRLSFGVQDKLAENALRLARETGLTQDASVEQVREAVVEVLATPTHNITKSINDLGRYVPYRFLTPWFAGMLHGIKDYKKNGRIAEFASASFQSEEPSLYRFVGPFQEVVELHPAWHRYLTAHLRIVTDFCLWNLLAHLRACNPNVPNIAGKLFAPKKRDMKTAKRFWGLVFEERGVLECIYSGVRLRRVDCSYDHFLPWSFIAHDQLWNLVPVMPQANSSKNNTLPDMPGYFDAFARLQRLGFNVVYQQGHTRLLEDYVLLFQEELGEIASWKDSTFRSHLDDHIRPMTQIAQNMGFTLGWKYELAGP